MKLQQIKYIYEVARNQLNVSATAESLFTSQPGISKQVRLLEDELGVEIFVRSGKHLTNITPAGREILPVAEHILKQVRKIQDIAASHVNHKEGRLNLSTTHTFSRYFLPDVVESYRKKYAKVAMHIFQSSGQRTNADLDEGKLDFALVHESENGFVEKIHLPCFYWKRCIVVPSSHPLAKKESINFDILAQYPLLTHTSMGGDRNPILLKFKEHGFSPEIVFSATDCEVIKSYVRMGLGVGIIANMAYEEHLDSDLVKIPIEHLISPSLVNIVFDRNFYFREYIFAFMEALAPQLSKELILQAQQTKSANKIAKMVDIDSIPVL
ncbi:LysR substrate-binding domain-containing protein [Aliikangiella coralliicola]|uniref:LysR family transcriptional regulator n=1 Tax=Aliikangiella coralliicola TaxID=2592383 RepID=A0A545U0B6_9GAMM|nr:LysR substrate-binding domain-containing protein [Aliikangiella coralliicola]TQV82905.1 LysR family transcriptional regulator [Aliikangiella coralliicola]